MRKHWRFIRKFIESPAQIGSVLPSSRMLVGSMMEAVDWQRANTVVELGAGTGVVTQAINRLRSPQSRFYCFEQDPHMRTDLMSRFPGVWLERDAFELERVLKQRGPGQADCIVSCLPFANLDDTAREHLLAVIHRTLSPGGLFIAFQYSRQLLPYLSAIYDDVDTRWVMLNMPPACVYICRKKQP
ncbi:phospholipid N-methyltransferase [Tamilnaduibacter salinus]|uniref:Phospholipid N-methyltransferase n=1 Tax=Tamilnaduibacter salinus TaxID=1484056 RepID=A0A2U1CVR5_9GAMM|nr:methyltransferase [Tamilnaduibacter salinus]PVY75827.1 phospholipid N-methyltransferase [Tamilnaduibacter salinus]